MLMGFVGFMILVVLCDVLRGVVCYAVLCVAWCCVLRGVECCVVLSGVVCCMVLC